MVIFKFANCQSLPEGIAPIKSHEKPPFSYGFHMVFLWFSEVKPPMFHRSSLSAAHGAAEPHGHTKGGASAPQGWAKRAPSPAPPDGHGNGHGNELDIPCGFNPWFKNLINGRNPAMKIWKLEVRDFRRISGDWWYDSDHAPKCEKSINLLTIYPLVSVCISTV